jgi:hypothetical protein
MLLVHVDLGRNIRGVCSFFLFLNQGSFALSQTWFALVGTRLQPAVLQVASLGPHLSVQIGC